MNRLEIIFYEKFRSDIYLVTEASGLDLRGELRKNFTATCYGYYLTEVLENFANTGEPDPAYWDLLEKAYGSLSGHPLFVSLVFQLKLLHHAGFLPDLQTVETRMEGKPGHLNPALIQNLRYLVKEEWGKALRLQMNKKDLEEAETLVAYLVSAKLEKNLKSRRFLNEINQS
jgi:recombinational DNA repair protein (RecF pathway)